MKKHFLELLKYNNWANMRMIGIIEDMSLKDEKLLNLFSHIISAQIIWLHRIKDLPTTPFPLWETYKLRELKSMVDESTRNWVRFLEDEHKNETYEEMIFYKNSEGVKYENTVRHIITHMINHSTYHRAQMAFRIRELNIDPPVTDYIVFCREQ